MRHLTATLLIGLAGALALAGPALAAPVIVKAEGDPGRPVGDPSVAVDDAGTAHVAYGYQNPDGSRLVGYCRLPRGATACEAGRVFPVDAAGTAPVVIRYQAPSTIAFVIQECCEPAYGPGNARTVAFVSTDGGSTFGARDKLAPGAPGAGGETAVDPHDAILVGGRFGWVNSISTFGTPFQADALGGGPATTRADIFPGSTDDSAVGLVDASSFSPLVVNAEFGPLVFRRFTGGDSNSEASWTPEASIDGQGEEPELAEGPAGLFLVYSKGTPGDVDVFVRRFDGTSFGGAVNTGLAYGDGNDIAQDGAGHLYAVADDNRDIKLAISRDGGATWSPSPNVATGESGTGNIHIDMAPDGRGWVVYGTSGGEVRAVELPGTGAPAGPPGGATPAPDITPPIPVPPAFPGATAVPCAPGTAGGVRCFAAAPGAASEFATAARALCAESGLRPGSTAYDRVILGTPADERIVGTTANDAIVSLGGEDDVNARAGEDCVFAGDGDDDIDGGNGDDLLATGDGDDEADAGDGDDRVVGGLGRDRLSGGRGGDRISGGASNDRLRGGPGSDRLFGDAGSDRLIGGSGNDRLVGRSGDDRLLGQRGRDALVGGSGRDRLLGGPGGDRLLGGSGRDVFSGGSGRDAIDARGQRRERVSCGSGFDRVRTKRRERDRIRRDCERVRRFG